MKAELIIKNAHCLTMAHDKTADWIAIKDGRILDLGMGQGYLAHQDQATALLDAEGNTVLPGIIDSHFHMVQAALNSQSLDLGEAASFEEIGALISAETEEDPHKTIWGIKLDQMKLTEQQLPSRTVLDRYCPNAPVVLNSYEYQKSALNTYALLYYKIPFTMDGVQFDQRQMPTGVIAHHANVLLRENILKSIPNTLRMAAVQEMEDRILSYGITTINAMEGGRLYSDKDAEFIYEYRNDFAADLVLFYQTMDIERIKAMGLPRIGGSLYLDGTFGARTSALSFDYADSPGQKGRLIYTQEELNDFVHECYLNRLQLALYAIGDRAIEQALVAHEYAMEKTGTGGLRHRLEHVELPTGNQLRRAKDLGLCFSMSPSYETIWGGPQGMYARRLGEGYQRTNPFREIVDAGVKILGGSDCDVTPANPFLGIHGAVNHPVSTHRVSLMEALRMYTINGAYGIFQEGEKGSLEKGKRADVIVLDCDICALPSEQIRFVTVKNTVKDGRLISGRGR